MGLSSLTKLFSGRTSLPQSIPAELMDPGAVLSGPRPGKHVAQVFNPRPLAEGGQRLINLHLLCGDIQPTPEQDITGPDSLLQSQ